MKFWKTLLVATSLILSGCVSQPKINWTIPEETQNRVQIENDEFEKTIKYRGPDVSEGIDAVFIRAWNDLKTKTTSYQIYVSDYYWGDWRFYRTAYDSDGNNLDTTLIDRDIGSCGQYRCSHYEHVGLNVTREYLEKHTASGIRFKLSGKAGEEIFSIPGAYIKGFLDAVPQYPINT